MKAIVLTYDRNAVLTEHMISCYEALWPLHPFVFRIPYQTALQTSGTRREYIKTPPEIGATVLKLTQDLDDEEWVYWCIDDKYPIQLDRSRIEPMAKWIDKGAEEDISGVLFCRARRMLDPGYLTGAQIRRAGETLLERKTYQQIWIHQFLRVKVLRFMFESFPDRIEKAKYMDTLKDQLTKPSTHKLYVTARNCAVFGESTVNGVLTDNCLNSLNAHGMALPDWHRGNPSGTITIGAL
jgi:hypothetical protein